LQLSSFGEVNVSGNVVKLSADVLPMPQPTEISENGKKNDRIDAKLACIRSRIVPLPSTSVQTTQPSFWSSSSAKRIFDCFCVVLTFPLTIPILLVIALAVRLTSRGPVLFIQDRMGCYGQVFRILKFRSLVHDTVKLHNAVTTACNQQFTPIGRFLRKWKLDELPQIFNVLAGQMSLVGPRPKIPEHVKFPLHCRPGLTCAATIAFACEEDILANVPKMYLDTYYHAVVLPFKRHLDMQYMAKASVGSDLRILVKTFFRRWDDTVLENMPSYKAIFPHLEMPQTAVFASRRDHARFSDSYVSVQSKGVSRLTVS
jgi:lipopolysaccharide/colanic/teichoic acid biosynthesis glycosyltransferase